jgi:CxxC motif-containing protein
MEFTGAVRLKNGKKHIISVQHTEDYPIDTWEDAMKALKEYPEARTCLVLAVDNKDLELA